MWFVVIAQTDILCTCNHDNCSYQPGVGVHYSPFAFSCLPTTVQFSLTSHLQFHCVPTFCLLFLCVNCQFSQLHPFLFPLTPSQLLPHLLQTYTCSVCSYFVSTVNSPLASISYISPPPPPPSLASCLTSQTCYIYMYVHKPLGLACQLLCTCK